MKVRDMLFGIQVENGKSKELYLKKNMFILMELSANLKSIPQL